MTSPASEFTDTGNTKWTITRVIREERKLSVEEVIRCSSQSIKKPRGINGNYPIVKHRVSGPISEMGRAGVSKTGTYSFHCSCISRLRLPNLETLSTTFTKPWNLVDNVYQTLKPCRLRLPNLETLSTTFTKPWNLVDNAYQTLKPCRQLLPNLETLSTTFTKPWNLVDYVYQTLKPCRLRLPTGTLNNVVNAFLLRWLDTSAWYSGCHKCILDSLRKLDSSTWYTGCHKCILTKMVR